MPQKPIRVGELLKLLPTEQLAAIALETEVDYQVKKLRGEVMFQLLLMSIINSDRVSLRIMEQLYESGRFKLMASIDPEDTTRFTSISDRMATIAVEYFRKIFEATYEILSKHYQEKHLEKFQLKRYDATIISASAKMLKSGMVNGMPKKQGTHDIKQIKMVVGFDGVLSSSARLFTDQKYLGDDLTLGEAILGTPHPKNTIVLFDRGLKKRITFVALDQNHIHFITRINPTKNYSVIREHENVKNKKTQTLELLSDQWVYLFHADKRKVKHPFRLIQAKSIADPNEKLLFVTNMDDLNAEDITDLYRHRWDIEVFFRFLKQELNLKHFTSYSQNGIQVMMYMTLIAAMLLMVYKKSNSLKGYKVAKWRFEEELDLLITRQIVILCGGDPNKMSMLNSS